jgi:nitroreductase
MTSRRALIAGGAGAVLLAALGYRAWDRGVFSSGQGPAYAPWLEWQGHAGEGVRRPLHAAILAANAHDSQPWLFAPSEDSITVFADRSRNLGSTDPFRREMHLSLGCALTNLQLAAMRRGFVADIRPIDGQLELTPSNDPFEAARVSLRRNGDLAMDAFGRLADAIPNRHTNRGRYRADREIPSSVLSALSDMVDNRDVRVKFVTEPAARRELSDIIVDATQRIISDRQMAMDGARWLRTGRREIEAHRDGISVDTAGLTPLVTAAAEMLPDLDADSANRYWLASTRDSQVPTAAVFGLILVRDRFDMAQAIAAGQAWQQMHLAATLRGIAAQPMNQPVEMADRDLMLGRGDAFKRSLARLARMADAEVTFVFRLGYGEHEALPSARRPLREVIRENGFA